MMTILNRLRGTIGTYAKVIGLLLSLITLIIYHNTYVALAVGLGYIIGETIYGWGDDVGNLTEHRQDLWYHRVHLAIRGFVWWIVPMIGLWFVGFNPYLLLGCLIFLSIGFPLACELGYYTAKRFSYQREGFSIVGGWEHQEIWYGLMQDLVLITLIGVGLWV